MTRFDTSEPPPSAGQDSTWSSAPKLSRKVRELALRSYRAVHSKPRLDGARNAGPEDVVEDLADLRNQLARLQRKIHERRLGVLIPWVDSLRRQVEERLGESGKVESR
jgi:hypothetical protein